MSSKVQQNRTLLQDQTIKDLCRWYSTQKKNSFLFSDCPLRFACGCWLTTLSLNVMRLHYNICRLDRTHPEHNIKLQRGFYFNRDATIKNAAEWRGKWLQFKFHLVSKMEASILFHLSTSCFFPLESERFQTVVLEGHFYLSSPSTPPWVGPKGN